MSAEARELLKAAKYIRDDLIVRAKIDGDEKIVACGCGAWIRLNNAIDAFESREVRRP